MGEEDPTRQVRRTTWGAAEIDLDEDTVDLLRSRLPAVAEDTVRAVIVEVPGYANALAGPMGANIQGAVQLALGGFLSLASRPRGSDPGTPLTPALEGAYSLGRGEARSGRSMDALLAAYRVGARVSWRQLSATAVETGLSAAKLSKFAELVFAYIDELSAASVAGHTDELATTGRVRQRYLQRLGRSLLRGEPAEHLAASAERADWDPPATLTAAVLPSSHARTVLASLDQRTLRPEEDLPDLDDEDESELAVLLVPDADGAARDALMRTLRGHQAYVGPGRPWTLVRASYLRVLRARRIGLPTQDKPPVDTEQHLTSLVVGADPAALADLRAQVLAPFQDLRQSTAERLIETLREWLLHQGRRDEVATALHVHPQTVRYRMGQVRDLLGDRLNDPDAVLGLTVALAYEPSPAQLG
ncbi:MAG TPA: helix-turn-helix domain-containing protein [Nocardioidaceae bacterium]|nr:helix-turn-helix domain-containing protein [Nocardioidaceae bacterium]